jgi:hypothetical protein
VNRKVVAGRLAKQRKGGVRLTDARLAPQTRGEAWTLGDNRRQTLAKLDDGWGNHDRHLTLRRASVGAVNVKNA